MALSSTERPQLSAEQHRVVELVRLGFNVFFTGDAGTGKTFVLRRVLEELRERFGDDYTRCVAVTATTGIAATAIHGCTLHAAMGLGATNTASSFSVMWMPENARRIQAMQASFCLCNQPSSQPSSQLTALPAHFAGVGD